jgi:hypothetical protein
MEETIVFTRYLYLKDEVKIALLSCILEKKEDAIFWGYELYYSGFPEEFFKYMWKIYYDYFATLNPSFEIYFMKKEKEWKKQRNDIIVSLLVQDLMIRPFNMDIFVLTKILPFQKEEIVVNHNKNTNDLLIECIQTEKYVDIAHILQNTPISDVLSLYENILSFLGISNKDRLLKEWKTMQKYNGVPSTDYLLIKIMTLISTKKGFIQGKNFYIHVDPEEIVMYETIDKNELLRPYRILKTACLFGTNDYEYLSLFTLRRQSFANDDELHQIYNENWLYYASFSPIWKQRITEYSGTINHENKCVEFENEDVEEEFYNKYNYEPDEQPLSVKEKNIPNITQKYNWYSFCQYHHNKYSLITIQI